jgi:hypothetical protein
MILGWTRGLCKPPKKRTCNHHLWKGSKSRRRRRRRRRRRPRSWWRLTFKIYLGMWLKRSRCAWHGVCLYVSIMLFMYSFRTEKIVFMQTSKLFLNIVPNTMHSMDFACFSDRIKSQTCIEKTLLRCAHAIKTLILDDCLLDKKTSDFLNAILNMKQLTVFSAIGTKLPYSILCAYVFFIFYFLLWLGCC